MKRTTQFTAVIEREGDIFVSLCSQLDIASQGLSIEEAKSNLQEAIELFFESASQTEIESRVHSEVFITQIEVSLA